MVDMSLHPENGDVWDEEGNVTEEEGTPHENTDNVRAANDLLAEIRPGSRQHPRHEVLEAYALMGTRNKPAINRAIGILTEVVNSDHDNVPALLAMSSCFMSSLRKPHLETAPSIWYSAAMNSSYLSWIFETMSGV